MQRVRALDGRRIIIFIVIPVLLAAFFVALDQVTKYFAERDNVHVTVIENFFYLSYSTNTGAGFSFLADKEWGQTLFKIITPIALVGFVSLFVFAVKKSYKWFTFAMTLIIAGTIGNYIDRLVSGKVVDFLSFQFGSYFFPTFNVADICLTVGVIMLIVHFFFFDENAVFGKKKDKKAPLSTEAGDADNRGNDEDA